MGMPGHVWVEIETQLDDAKLRVSRTIEIRGGIGLNWLSLLKFGNPKSWNTDKSLFSDSIDLPDGRHKLAKKYVGPGKFDYKWRPVEDGEEDYE
jgi:hypothetical protein